MWKSSEHYSKATWLILNIWRWCPDLQIYDHDLVAMAVLYIWQLSSSSSSYSFNVRDPKTHTVFQASALARVGPPVIFLQAQRSCAISSFIPIAFMSLLTQLLHVFLGAPLSTTPITFILVHFFTQLFSSFRSTCPNHLNLPLCILFSTHSMPKRFKSSSLQLSIF